MGKIFSFMFFIAMILLIVIDAYKKDRLLDTTIKFVVMIVLCAILGKLGILPH